MGRDGYAAAAVWLDGWVDRCMTGVGEMITSAVSMSQYVRPIVVSGCCKHQGPRSET